MTFSLSPMTTEKSQSLSHLAMKLEMVRYEFTNKIRTDLVSFNTHYELHVNVVLPAARPPTFPDSMLIYDIEGLLNE